MLIRGSWVGRYFRPAVAPLERSEVVHVYIAVVVVVERAEALGIDGKRAEEWVLGRAAWRSGRPAQTVAELHGIAVVDHAVIVQIEQVGRHGCVISNRGLPSTKACSHPAQWVLVNAMW